METPTKTTPRPAGAGYLDQADVITSIPPDLRKIFDEKYEIIDTVRQHLFCNCESQFELHLFKLLINIAIETVSK